MNIALVGNPNCGKTTLFNALTNKHASVGNYPGVTVDKIEANISNTNLNIIDLPGIYSLNATSIDEQITTNYLLNNEYDCILNVIDINYLERSLYLALQLLELNKPIILIFNKIDEFNKHNTFDINKARNIFGCDMITISALKDNNYDKLISLIKNYKNNHKTLKIFDRIIENKIISSKDNRINTILELSKNDYYHELITTSYYNYASKCYQLLVTKIDNKPSISDKIDKILLNKYLAFIFFIIIMGFIYYFSIHIIGSISDKLFDRIELILINKINIFLTNNNAHVWLFSLVNKGIVYPLFSLFKFVFQIFFLFIGIGILESCGYLARIGFIFDKIFQKFHLSGKSLIPFILGINCSVHGIISTRTITDDKERKLTIMLTPFIPCLAKLPMISIFSSYFFKDYAWLIALSFYLLSILVIFISAIILNTFYFKINKTSYLFEIPSYQIPNMKYVISDSLFKTIHFIKKTSTIILASCLVSWFLLSFDMNFNYCSVDNSILAIISKKISWLFYPVIGKNDYRVVIASLQGIIAKEQVITSLTMINELSSSKNIFSLFDKSSAYSFICFNLFTIPCINAISTLKHELNDRKTFILSVVFQVLFSYVLASIIHFILVLFV